MKPIESANAFSLIDLLVAICILVIVATIAIPMFLCIQSQAENVTAQQVSSELNNTYVNWKTNGGVVGTGATTANILQVLTSNSAVSSGVVQDSGTSSNIRIANTPGFIDAITNAVANGSVVVYNGMHIYYYATDTSGGYVAADQFYVASAAAVNTPYDGGPITWADYPLLKSAWLSRKGDQNYIAKVDYMNNGFINTLDYNYFVEHVQ